MGRIKEISRTPTGKRKRNPVVYIICEGSETEVKYFKRFRSRGCHIDIQPLPSQYKSADKLIQKARSTMGNNPYYPDEGDTIWCVFDRDDNTNTMLRTAQTQATKEGYKIIFSNPSFELWYLFHFTDQNSAIEDSDSVIRLLKRNSGMEQYEKSNDVYDILKPLQGDAMMRAKRRLSLLEASGAELLCRESNPVTSVCELVEYLNQHK